MAIRTRDNPNYWKEWVAKNPEKYKEAVIKYRQTDKYRASMRNNRYKRLFGISLDEYNEMLENQNYVCLICHCPETSKHNNQKIKELAVDHCHSTGKVRGLLCDRCNHILGLAKDSKTLLLNAIAYLGDSE